MTATQDRVRPTSPTDAPARAGTTPSRTGSGRVRRLAFVLAGYALLFGAWSYLALYYFTPFILPPPWTVAEEMWELLVSGAAITHFASSIGKIVLGFAIGSVVGIPVGLLMGRSRYAKNLFQPPVLILGNVPGLTYAVFALILFGIGAVGPVVAVALVSLPYVALNVAEGVEGVDKQLIHMSTVYGRSRADVVRRVFLPSVMPFLFAALRYGFAMAWKVEALTEVFGGRSGIGFMIRAEYQEFSVTGVLAWTAFFVIFILVIERVFLAQLERRIFSWRGKR